METDKPLAGALRAVENHCDHTEPQAHWIEDMDACSECVQLAHVIARESGLAELVEAVEELEQADFKNLRERSTESLTALIAAQRKVFAAARRVKEG